MLRQLSSGLVARMEFLSVILITRRMIYSVRLRDAVAIKAIGPNAQLSIRNATVGL